MYTGARMDENNIGLFLRTMQTRRKGSVICKMFKEKNPPTQNSVPRELSFKSEGEIKTFSEEEKLREFIASIPALQEMLKKILQREGK